MFKRLAGYLFLFSFISAMLVYGIGKIDDVTFRDNNLSIRNEAVAAEVVALYSDSKSDDTIKETGKTLVDNSKDQETENLAAVPNLKGSYRLQVSWSTNIEALSDWVNRARNAGYSAFVEPYYRGYTLCIGEFPDNTSWEARKAFRNELISKGLAESDSYWRIVKFGEGDSELDMLKEKIETITNNPIRAAGTTIW